jgi:uncharacterized protein (AIM24 family)
MNQYIPQNPIGTRDNINIISSNSYGGVKVDIMEYQKFLGMSDVLTAQALYFMEQQNMKVRQIVVSIQNDGVKIEPGAMSYFQGPLEMVSGVSATNFIGKALKGAITGEKMARPEYKGSGTLVLEPSFRHSLVLTLEPKDEIIVDKGMFYLTSTSAKVEPVLQQNISSGLLGNEGLFQIKITGPGIVVLESDVPMQEINIINLNNDVLKVDGNFAILRTSSIDFTVERSAKTLVGSAVSGEGLVNVFRGTGQVWLAPSLKVYSAIQQAQMLGVTDLKKINMNTSK